MKNVSKKVIKVEGMVCSHCSSRVEKALKSIKGVKAKVDLDEKCAYVEAKDGVTDQQLIDAVVEAGFEVTSIE